MKNNATATIKPETITEKIHRAATTYGNAADVAKHYDGITAEDLENVPVIECGEFNEYATLSVMKSATITVFYADTPANDYEREIFMPLWLCGNSKNPVEIEHAVARSAATLLEVGQYARVTPDGEATKAKAFRGIDDVMRSLLRRCRQAFADFLNSGDCDDEKTIRNAERAMHAVKLGKERRATIEAEKKNSVAIKSIDVNALTAEQRAALLAMLQG